MDDLSGSHDGGSLPSAPLLVADRTEFPLSSGQEQLWFLDQLSPGETTYNISLAYRLRGRLDVEALRRSLTLPSTNPCRLISGTFPHLLWPPRAAICSQEPAAREDGRTCLSRSSPS